MKRIYSFVLMAVTLLFSTNMWADQVVDLIRNNAHQAYYESVQEAIDAAQSGDELQLIADVETTAPIWLGTIAVDGTPKSLTLDLNGHSITSGVNVVTTFILSHGALKVKNSIPGQGGIYNMYTDTICSVFMVHGTYERGINPRTAAEEDLFSFLTIEEGVDLHADLGSEASAIIVKELITYPNPEKDNRSELAKMVEMEYSTDVYRHDASWTKGVANGVRVDVKGHLSAKKYGLQVNGNVRYPNPAELNAFWKPYGWQQNFRNTMFPTLGDVDMADTAYVPYIHIYPSAVIEQEATNSYGVAVYSSGYSHMLIEGTCAGATGLYMKGGEVTLDDAKITSAWNGESTLIETSSITHGTGVNSSGHAIVVESVSAYPGEVVLIVEGDTKIETEAQGGAALYEIVSSTTPETKVDSIVVKGGNFTGGEDGYSMVISPITITDPEAEIIVYGTTVNSGVNIGGVADISGILAANTHTTVITSSDNTTTVIVSAGEVPDGVTEWAEVKNGEDVNWQGSEPVHMDANLSLGELQLISGTSAQVQQLTIASGATLEVERLIMNEYARVIVEAGSRLVVTGEQGINAPSVNNIVLKAAEGNYAYFLFNPAVTSNRHPNATVEFTSKSVTTDSYYSKQRFGIPTYSAVKSMTTKNGGEDVQTALSFFSYAQNDWIDFGWINISGKAENLDIMNRPFDYYQMQHNTPNVGTIVTMTGELYGNTSPEMAIRSNSWNGYANSYMAPINGEQLINLIPNQVDKAFYLYDMAANYATWEPVTLIDVKDMNIQPMQPFLLRNTRAASNTVLDYATAVWEPATSGSNQAPARRSAMSDITRAKLIVKGEGCIDRVTVAEGDEFTAEFDNGYDAVKYMNEGINMYIPGNENMSVYATDDLSGTYVGLQTVKGGSYTMEFAKVQGEELILVDHETNARVAMVEGGVYAFTATANSTNDYRFEVVPAAKMPTAIENTEAKASAKGIYTITGQYVGEMNVWNSLPAGIYVVNGAKRVK